MSKDLDRTAVSHISNIQYFILPAVRGTLYPSSNKAGVSFSLRHTFSTFPLLSWFAEEKIYNSWLQIRENMSVTEMWTRGKKISLLWLCLKIVCFLCVHVLTHLLQIVCIFNCCWTFWNNLLYKCLNVFPICNAAIVPMFSVQKTTKNSEQKLDTLSLVIHNNEHHIPFYSCQWYISKLWNKELL